VLSKLGSMLNRDIALRLSFWYALILVALFTVSFFIFFSLANFSFDTQFKKEILSETEERVAAYKDEGLTELKELFLLERDASGGKNISQCVLDPDGRILMTCDTPQWKDLAVDNDLLRKAMSQDKPVVATIRIPMIRSRIHVAYAKLSPDKILRIAFLLRHKEMFFYGLKKILIVTMAITLAAVFFVGGIILKQVVARVTTVADTALSISSSSMSKRVPVSRRGDEIDMLARSFNGMLDRIEILVKGLNEVTDNVAHDLKIPLARIRLTAESLLTAARGKTDVPEQISVVIEESDRLLEMINTTLEIKAIEAGAVVQDFSDVNIASIVEEACELFQLVAEDKGLILHLNKVEPFIVKGDLHRLQRVFSNLLDNSVKYTPRGGKIEVTIRSSVNEIAIEISDTGIGIAPDSMPRIFERFYRGDKSRSTPGLGLGLSLADSIVKLHGGTIKVSSQVGAGSVFTVILPGRQS
jgi:signal transduction histidine kinase